MNFTKEQIQQQLNNCLIGHCSNGHLDLAELLINKAGVDVNARDDMTDETALMGACQGGHVMMVSYLLERGADVNAKQHCRHWQGVTALMKASSVGNEEIVKILFVNYLMHMNISNYPSLMNLFHYSKKVLQSIMQVLCQFLEKWLNYYLEKDTLKFYLLLKPLLLG